ncbi:hypothetical protein C7448_1103 [Tenacibaculum gallaicum]|uniref:Pyrroloquinoline-quinone binding quinoprotein n=1 Tax=Tenacibaculum gallaicum TaxID=561505 RepID=A0A3E0HGN3_9FLAO|nr:hypothetical protein [Tenacibaculum gallaicum]REH44980.1 hypothetical protein C7448_1103 [Tenacibaculum gallaicum]
MAISISRFIILLSIICVSFSCSSSSDSNNPNDNSSDPNINDPIDTTTESAIEFQKNYQTNDSIFTLNSAIQLNDSSYTIAGAVRYNGSFNKNTIMKFDKYGNRVWTKIMQESYTPQGIEKLFLNGTGFMGYRGHHYDVDNSSHILYYNSSGDVVNEIFTNNDILGNDIIKDGNNYVITGIESNNMHLRKLDENGQLLWDYSYGSSEAFSVSKLTDGNYILIGGANSDGTSADYLIKTNNSGEKIWSKNSRGFNTLAISNNQFLAVVYTGYFSGNLVRFDENGNTIWTRELTNFITDINKPSPLTLVNYDMEYFICTYVNLSNDLNILVLDENGNEINSHIIDNYNGADYTFVSKTIDNGLLIGYTGVFDFGIVKISNEFLFK